MDGAPVLPRSTSILRPVMFTTRVGAPSIAPHVIGTGQNERCLRITNGFVKIGSIAEVWVGYRVWRRGVGRNGWRPYVGVGYIVEKILEKIVFLEINQIKA